MSKVLLVLLFLALASDARRKPPMIYLPYIEWRDPHCGYYEPLDRWYCFKETQP